MNTSNYSASGILWSGFIQAVKLNAPLDMQTRLAKAAEDAEALERTQPNNWPDRPYGEEGRGEA